MRTFAASCLFALVTIPALATTPSMPGYGALDAPRDIDPIRLGQLFCESRVREDMQPLERFFAPKLAGLLDELEASHLAMAVPWQSFIHRPSSCTVEILNGFDDTIGVLVQISYQAPQARWSDVINLERTPDTWLINNVFYEGGGNLRFRLFEALD
jgi:hypothetical protein